MFMTLGPSTLLYLGVMAGQFHGGRYDQAPPLTGNPTGPLDIPGETRSEAQSLRASSTSAVFRRQAAN